MIRIGDLLSHCDPGYMIAVEMEYIAEDNDNIMSVRYYHGMQEDEVVWLLHILRHWNAVGSAGAMQIIKRNPPPGSLETNLPRGDFDSDEEHILGNIGLNEGVLIGFDIVESYYLEEEPEDLTEELTNKWDDYAS